MIFGLILELSLLAVVVWLVANLIHYFLKREGADGFFFLSNHLINRKGKKDESQGSK